jgi:hypothetical protein
MALNFPDNPSINDVHTDSTSGFSYQWDGVVWKSYSPSSASQIKILDDISGSFNGSTQTFSLTSGGNSLTPPNSQSLVINIGGVIQDPSDDYSVSGSNITFSTPPTSGLTFSGVSLGPAVPINTIPDGTVTGGSLRISTTAVVGSATTFTEDLVVSGSARVTGILTVGNSSITFDGTNNTIRVGTGLTLSSSGITGTASSVTSATTAFGLSGTPNLNVGVVTASSFVGNVTGTATGLSGAPNLNVGVITSTNLNITNNTGIRTTNPIQPLQVGSAGTTVVVIDTLGEVGIGTTNPTSKLDLFGSSTQSIVAISASDIDCSLGNYFTDTISGSKTYTVSNVPSNRVYSFTLEVNHTSGTITWFSGVEWPNGTAPTLTTGKTHLFMFVTDNNGSRWRASSLINYTT